MTRPGPDAGRAAQDDVRLERHVLGEVDAPVEVDRRGVAHRHAGPHVGLVEPDPQAPLGGGELAAVVDAVEPAVVLEGDGRDDPAVLARERDEIGQVELAGRRRGRQRSDAATEPGRIEGVQAGVRLVRLELLGGRVLRLDDPLDRPELAADHAAEGRRVGGEDAREGDRGVVLAARLEHRLEVGAGHERHVAVDDEDLGRVGRDARRARRGPRPRSRAGIVLEREGRPIGEDRRRSPRPTASRRRPASAPSRPRPCSPRRRARRRASGDRTARGGPSGATSACASRDRPPARRRRRSVGGVGSGRVTRGGAVGRGSGDDGRSRRALGPALVGRMSSIGCRHGMGAPFGVSTDAAGR